jgi:hypothetical protein
MYEKKYTQKMPINWLIIKEKQKQKTLEVKFNWLGFGFAFQKLSVRVLQILGSLKVYVIINFRICEISQDIHKLVRTPTFILKKLICKRYHHFLLLLPWQPNACMAVNCVILGSFRSSKEGELFFLFWCRERFCFFKVKGDKESR